MQLAVVAAADRSPAVGHSPAAGRSSTVAADEAGAVADGVVTVISEVAGADAPKDDGYHGQDDSPG